MERLAEASGDIDELITIKSKVLSSGYGYLAIAEILDKAARADDADVGGTRPAGFPRAS